MRVLAIVHQADAGPGVFAEAAATRGCDLLEWTPSTGPPPEESHESEGVLVLGGAMNPDEESAHPWLADVKRRLAAFLEWDTPVLGICLGAELLAEAAGGSAVRMAAPQIGWHDVELTDAAAADPLLGRLPSRFPSFQWHGWGCGLPAGAVALARNGEQLDAFRIGSAWGLQFHPEVTTGIVQEWLADWRSDPGAVAAGFDPEPVRAETPARIEESNRIGVRIFDRFLEYVAARERDLDAGGARR